MSWNHNMLWKNFSFIIPELLAGMSYPGYGDNIEETLDELRQKNIFAIVNLTDDDLYKEFLPKKEIQYLYSPVRNFHAPSIEQTDEIIAFINTFIQEKKGVVVHCIAGQGRTGTILACYLVTQNMLPDDAITTIRAYRPGSIESVEQENFIHNYAAHCQSKIK